MTSKFLFYFCFFVQYGKFKSSKNLNNNKQYYLDENYFKIDKDLYLEKLNDEYILNCFLIFHKNFSPIINNKINSVEEWECFLEKTQILKDYLDCYFCDCYLKKKKFIALDLLINYYKEKIFLNRLKFYGKNFILGLIIGYCFSYCISIFYKLGYLEYDSLFIKMLYL